MIPHPLMQDGAYEAFQGLDSDGDGRLMHSEVVELFRFVLGGSGGGPSDRQVQSRLNRMH